MAAAGAEPSKVQPEELRGDADLFLAHGLQRIYEHVLSGQLKQGNYLRPIPGKGLELRKGPGLDLAPLAELHPSAVKPELAPLTKAQLQAAFAFQPGGCALSEAEKGAPVANALGGSAAAAPSAGAQQEPKKKRKASREPGT